jgi:hypothetical protein
MLKKVQDCRKLYVSGPMTGYPDWNNPAFREATAKLQKMGYTVLSPVGGGEPGWSWEDYLRWDLQALLLNSDGVATLPGWQESRGACFEIDVAQRLGMVVMPVDVWLKQPRS